MACGKPIAIDYNHTKDTTLWIRSQAMAFIRGIMAGATKETSKMIRETAMANYMKTIIS